MHDDFINDELRASAGVKLKIAQECTAAIGSAADALLTAFRGGRKVLICGNGGSAADAQHMAAEFVVRMTLAGRAALPAIALTTDSSALTAAGNDLGFEKVFARQVEALGGKSDVLIGISTSGNSPNVVRAMEEARVRGLVTIGFLGRGGGKIAPLCDHPIVVPSEDTQRIQEGHLSLIHILVGIVERSLFGKAK
jgi:D-sedoheptulose 7-phosphate isomerase